MNDKYKVWTDEIIAKLEQGVLPWRVEHGYNRIPVRHNDIEYTGVNVLSLMIEASKRGYINNQWMTFNQIKTFGAHVRKGEHSTPVCFFKKLIKKADKKGVTENEQKDNVISMMRYYNVFNVAQVDGLQDKYYLAENINFEFKECDAFINDIGAVINTRSVVPCFKQLSDIIEIPHINTFENTESYYSTVFHELIHWTGHKDRLERFKEKESKADYGFEELVAEIGSVFICAKFGLESEIDDNHISYIKGWYTRIKANPKLLIKAASLAQKACDYIFEQVEINSQDQPQAKALLV